MAFPDRFAFSQASLQDYADCARRFQLRYVLGVQWPAVRAEAVIEWEQRGQRGAAFHRLVHQRTVGIPVEVLHTAASEGEVHEWWRAYLSCPPDALPGTVRKAEARLSMPLGTHRLTARYDLLAIEPGQRAVIVDWKTNERRPKRSWLEKRLQTVVYRYVLVEAGAELNGGEPFAPTQVELIYWFAAFPQQAERFAYDRDQHRAAGEQLCEMIDEIVELDGGEWPLTSDLSRCIYCPFGTLCGREGQVEVAEVEEAEPELDSFDVDLEQIAEIEF
jgi:CRISPR/Cas system-associated exonuclease Cas4 (RecB family)